MQRLPGTGAGDEEHAALPKQVAVVLDPVHLRRGDLLRERYGLGGHPQHRDAAELEPLHRVHGGQPYPVDVRAGLVPHPDRRNPRLGQRVVHRIQQQIEPGADGDLARPYPLVEPLPHPVHQRGDLVLLGRVPAGVRALAVQQRAVAGQAVVAVPAEVLDR